MFGCNDSMKSGSTGSSVKSKISGLTWEKEIKPETGANLSQPHSSRT